MNETRVLVTYASKNGSTARIAEAVGEALAEQGLDVDVRPVGSRADLSPYRAVVLGSAVYAFRWRRGAVSFLRRNRKALAERRVWLFQSGPLDDSAEKEAIPLPGKVAALAEQIGVRRQATFGGRLDATASGFLARKMVQNGRGGDFRNFDRIRAWAADVGKELAAPAR